MPHHYRPRERPLQHVHLLKELGRTSGKRKHGAGARSLGFGVSTRELRRSTAQLFAFKSLTPIPHQALDVLKQVARENALRHMQSHTEAAHDLSTGKSSRIISRKVRNTSWKKGMPAQFQHRVVQVRTTMKPDEVRKFFLEKRKYDRPILGKHSIGSLGPGSRDLRGYREESLHEDVLQHARAIIRRKGSTIRVLDVGSAKAEMLRELKAKLGKKVETHALSPEYFPHEKVDHYHVLLSENLPAEFRRRFDLITSNRALEYTIFPHLAIRNISEALALGGRALLMWRYGRASYGDERLAPKVRDALTSSPEAQLKPETIAFLIALNKKHGREITEESIKTALQEMKQDADVTQAIAYCNEIVRLQRDPQLRVKVKWSTSSPFGWIPMTLIIDRKK